MEIFETHDAILKEMLEPNFDFKYYENITIQLLFGT